MTLSEQARAIRAVVGHYLAGRIPDLIELRAALLARHPHSRAAHALAALIAHRVGERAERN